MTHTLLLIQWPVPPGEGWSAGYNGLDRSVALGRSVNGSLHKQQQTKSRAKNTKTHSSTFFAAGVSDYEETHSETIPGVIYDYSVNY